MANWNRPIGIAQLPAASGTAARNGPKNRPKNTPAIPQRAKKRSPRGNRSGVRVSGQTRAIRCLKWNPSQYDTQSPRNAPATAAAQHGQNGIPLAPSSPDIPNRMAVAGSSSDTSASDSPNANTNTIGAAQAWLARMNASVASTNPSMTPSPTCRRLVYHSAMRTQAAFTAFRLALFPALAVLIAWRLPLPLAEGRFWAEEGLVYYSRAWHLPALDALLALHSGYLNIVANAATLIAAHSVALENAPRATAAIALLFQLLPALLLATAAEPWLRRPFPLLAAVLLTILPVRAGELWLNAITSHFHLMACVGLILALVPRPGPVGHLRLALLVLAPLAGPGSAFLWPLLALRAWRDPARRLQLAALTLGIAVQASLVLLAPAESRPFGAPLHVVLAVLGLEHVLLPLLGGALTAPIAHAAYLAFEAGRPAWWLVALPLPVFAAAAWAVVTRADATTRWLFLAGLWLATISYYAALTLGKHNMLLLGLGMRYAFAPSLLFGACLVGLAATTPAPRLKQAATGLVWWLLAVGTVSYHDNPGFTAGPSWAAQVAAWRANPAHVLEIWPPGWTMRLAPK